MIFADVADLSRCEIPYHDDQHADFLQDAFSPLCHTNTLLAPYTSYREVEVFYRLWTQY
jgi:hypothetical protein